MGRCYIEAVTATKNILGRLWVLMTKTSLVKGTAVLAAAGLFVKFLGAFFRIPLANMIGAAGMASYAPAYSLYNFLLVFSTAGIPVAVSKMVSERQADGRCREAAQVFHLSRMLMFMTGITGFGIVFLYAEEIAGLFHVPGCVYLDASYGTGTVSGPAGCFLSWIFPGNEQYDSHKPFLKSRSRSFVSLQD